MSCAPAEALALDMTYYARNTRGGVLSDTTTYKGVPLGDLVIEEVMWTPDAAEHLRTRTDRYQPGETNIEPEWATEAALDPYRVVRVATHEDRTAALKVIGFSKSALGEGRLLKVWIWSDDPTKPTWDGASACLANDSDRRRYEES